MNRRHFLQSGAAALAASANPGWLRAAEAAAKGRARSPIHFSDVTDKAGIHFRHFPGVRSSQLPEDMGSGAAWGDYNNDGHPDLYVVDIAAPLTATAKQLADSPGGNRLYRNNGDGTFTDVTKEAGVGFKGVGMAAAWADYDNDGHLDLVVTSFDRIVLYHNNGDGTFTDVTKKVGLDRYRGFWTGIAWGDFDRDGLVELYVCGYVQYQYRAEYRGKSAAQSSLLVPYMLDPEAYLPERNLLFHFTSNGTFTEIGKHAGVDAAMDRSLGASWCDFDNDGWPDLYVANDLWGSKLFLNQRNGAFKDVTRRVGLSDFRGQMGVAVGDWNNDGNQDLFVTHWLYEKDALFTNLAAAERGKRGQTDLPPRPSMAGTGQSVSFSRSVPSSLAGKLDFADLADEMGIAPATYPMIGWGTSFFDFDNDGKLDLFVVNGSTFQDGKDPHKLVPMKNLFFWQQDQFRGFQEVGTRCGDGFLVPQVGRGAAFADYDGDGRIDAFIVNHQGRGMLLHNDGASGNHWLNVRVKCRRSNRTGFGAKVEIIAAGRRQIQEIGTQAPYLSQNFPEAHFGLGKIVLVEAVRVTFPSGVVRDFQRLGSNQTITVEE